MSMHKIPLTADEREGLQSHGLDIATPSQLSDVFRQGMAWANSKAAAECERLRSPTPVCLCGLRTTLNPHPDAGKPEHFLKVGAVYVCIPCLNKANHGHCKEANKLRTERDAALAELAALKGGQEVVAFRLLNIYGEVITDWEDGSPPERITDTCGVVQTEVTVELAYAAPPAQASAWVAVSESLPADRRDVMLYCADTKEHFVGFSKGGGLFQFAQDGNGLSIVCRPSHWRYIEDSDAPTPGASDGKGGDV